MPKDTDNAAARILAAAEQEFLQKGFAGVKTMEIARRAGVTHPLLHYYFHTKEQLFNQVFEQKISLLARSVIEALTTPGLTLEERLRAGIGRHFDFLAENPDLPRFVLNELISRPENLAVARHNLGRVLQAAIGSMQHEVDALAAEGHINPVRFTDLLIDIVSLNVFVFIAYPIMEPFVTGPGCTREDFLRRRRAENIETVLRRLRPAAAPVSDSPDNTEQYF